MDQDLKPQSLSLFLRMLIGFFSIIASAIVYLFYKLYIRPKYRMMHYRGQGIPNMYFPGIGRFFKGIAGLRDHNDAQYFVKTKSKTDSSRIMCTNFGSDASIVLYDPILIKQFYLNPENYTKDKMILQIFDKLWGKNLITTEGAEWKSQRKVLSSAFHFEFFKSVIPMIQETTRQSLQEQKNISLKNVNLMDAYQAITGEVVGKIFFGEQLNKYKLDGMPLTLFLADLIVGLGLLNLTVENLILGTKFIERGIMPKHRRLMRKIEAFRNTCSEIIEERRVLRKTKNQETKTKDLLDLLLDYQGEEGKASDEEIIDQFITFFLAGMDTTGHLITMVTYYLHKYPDYKTRMVEEIKQNYPKQQTVNIDDLNKLDFSMAMLKETLRMATPVPGAISRRAIKDHRLGEFTIKSGDIVGIDFFHNLYNSKYFENADNFDPDRWLGKEKLSEPYAYTPFAAGPRNCIGQHLALIEARIILAEFLTMYDFKIDENYKLKMDFTFLYEPLEPLKADLTVKE